VKVWLDTNILLDVLANRHPFYTDSARVWTLAEEGHIEGLISPISFTNVFYVLRKLKDAKTARRALKLLRGAFRVGPCDDRALSSAIDSDIKDFEDAVQYISAVDAGADFLVTRNPADFPQSSELTVLTPTEFLAAYALKNPKP
jgi:predicted nucleic acid-binding protein